MATEPPHLIQTSTQPPAQPAYVLRGHSAQVHSVHFLNENLRLLSGDAEGWVVLWNVPIRRPVAVWRAHKDTILGVGSWGEDRIITHGRDSKLKIWQIKQEDETTFSTVLPIEDAVSERKLPWLLHSLTVNTLNFCSFTMCEREAGILVATPGVQDGFINLTALPSEQRVATIPTPKDAQTGMIMAIGLHQRGNEVWVLAGYENGQAVVWKQDDSTKHWQTLYVNKAHTQPILSLDVSATLGSFFTSSADAIIARHPLSTGTFDTKAVQTKHAGQQSLTVRSDEKIFATAGWDGRARVYSAKSMKELAVLKWLKEGCYALAFAHVRLESDVTLTKHELTVSEQRIEKAKTTHWLAAGSKDGKISLWDIY